MIRVSTAVLSLLLLIVPVVAQEEAPKPRMVKVSVEELVKEFQSNTDAAVQRYAPPTHDPTRVLVCIGGVVAAVDARNNEVGLAAAGVRVILHAKTINGVQPGDKIEATGMFDNYFKRTILIQCDEVRLVKP